MANKRRVIPIKIGHYEVLQVIPVGPPNGSVLVFNLECGNCRFKFEGRYPLAQLAQGFPQETCANCDTVNYVPYTISGRNG